MTREDCQLRVLSVVPDFKRAQSRIFPGGGVSHFYFPASRLAVVACVVPSLSFIVIVQTVQLSRLLVDFHRVLPTNPLKQEHVARLWERDLLIIL